MTELDLGTRADERSMLDGFLDWYRAVVENKVAGMPLELATRVMTPTGLSALGVVAHLSGVEVGWFAESFAGEPEDPAWEVHGNFRLHADDTVESVLAEYRDCCARSRRIAASAPSLDALSVSSEELRGKVSLRWIMVHMIEETARHAGHLDLMCEALDGRVGD
jgi:hypothetical protein